MSAAHDPTGIAQGGWREEGAGDKSALNEEMEAETSEYHRVYMRYDAVCFVSHVERYMYLLLPPSSSYSSFPLLSSPLPLSPGDPQCGGW